MTTANFINSAREAGFKEEQAMFLLDKFEYRDSEVVTKDYLTAALSKMELRIYAVVASVGFGAVWFLYSKLSTMEQTLAVISSKLL